MYFLAANELIQDESGLRRGVSVKAIACIHFMIHSVSFMKRNRHNLLDKLPRSSSSMRSTGVACRTIRSTSFGSASFVRISSIRLGTFSLGLRLNFQVLLRGASGDLPPGEHNPPPSGLV
jgi:hypothetical protein